ncbi:hypothetical protein DFH05DRAFT_1491562 [Lentinula detonsa]|uniref:ABM domain-containing protein n=1 Tax=Lentinula detonsa TaxID=2804962 RepID=A0A9W8P1G4_9AGAR|nr:hypothetical protein DFH05DRAFT_1491562 [Lentinula detonsa]
MYLGPREIDENQEYPLISDNIKESAHFTRPQSQEMSLANPPQKTASGRFLIIATIRSKPGKEETLAELLKLIQKRANSDEEPGTFTYRVTRRIDAEGKHLSDFVIIEEYDGAAGLKAHMAAAPFQNVIKIAKEQDLMDGELSGDFLDEI